MTLTNEKLKLQLEDRERTIAHLDKMTSTTADWRHGGRNQPRTAGTADDFEIDRRRRDGGSDRYERDASNIESIR